MYTKIQTLAPGPICSHARLPAVAYKSRAADSQRATVLGGASSSPRNDAFHLAPDANCILLAAAASISAGRLKFPCSGMAKACSSDEHSLCVGKPHRCLRTSRPLGFFHAPCTRRIISICLLMSAFHICFPETTHSQTKHTFLTCIHLIYVVLLSRQAYWAINLNVLYIREGTSRINGVSNKLKMGWNGQVL